MEVELPIFKIENGNIKEMSDSDVIHEAADMFYNGDIKKLVEEWFKDYHNGDIYKEIELKHDVLY